MTNRTAYLVNFGVSPYTEVWELQKRIVQIRKNERICDVVLVCEHPPEVSFGRCGEFSQEFIDQIKNFKRNPDNPRDFTRTLNEMGLSFSRSGRGGSATILAPGLVAVYPIVNYIPLCEEGNYGRLIDQTLLHIMQEFGINDAQIAGQNGESKIEVSGSSSSNEGEGKERRDIWVSRNEEDIKLGSKGLRFNGSIASGGFVVNSHESGLKYFWVVNPCGYTSNEIKIGSIEGVTGRKPTMKEIHTAIRNALMTNFGYDQITELKRSELGDLLS